MDFFTILNEPRRPWLDADSLKEKFLALSSVVHPDRVHQSDTSEKITANNRYTELNAAYHGLRDPKERLRHLIGLERGYALKDLGQPPNELVELSFQVGHNCREADGLITEAARATSPLLKVNLFERSQEQIEKLQSLQKVIITKQDGVLRQLKECDSAWMAKPETHEALLPRLELVAAQLGFFARWLQQLQERQLRLTF